MLPSLKSIADALNVLKGSDPAIVDAVAADLRLEKAMEASGLDAPEVKDPWTMGNLNKVAPKEDIKFGPNQSSSGFGAEKMVGDYAHPAGQSGITLTAEKLADYFGPVNSSMKAQTSILLQIGKSIEELLTGPAARGNGIVNAKADAAAATAATAAATAKAAEDEEDDEEESEVVEINEKSAKSLLTKAASLLSAAKAKKAEAKEMDEMGEEEKCKALKLEAYSLRKAAARTLGKARAAAYVVAKAKAAAKVEIGKSLLADIRKAATKADIDVVQEDEESEEDEAEKAKKAATPIATAAAAAPAATAKADDAGNQADRKDATNGNQAAAAAKSTADAAAIEKALEGFGVIQSDIKSMMNTLMNSSKNGPNVPNFLAKATPAQAESLTERIFSAVDSGELMPDEGDAARDIIAKAGAANRGLIDAKIVVDRIAKATPNVKSFFDASIKNAA